VQSLRLNGKAWTHNYIEHGDLVKGAGLRFGMGTEPAVDRGTRAEDKPYSFSQE
jgi:putative alpha-1,2-mannosidase